MKYIPEQDRSEEFGWKKWNQESKPTEQEQCLWSRISLAVAALLGGIPLVF